MAYRNLPMTRDEAAARAIDLGILLADRDGFGRVKPGTSRCTIAARGDGFDAVIPIELVAALYDRGRRDEREAARQAILDTADGGDY
jgi:hypothetical protein